MKLYHLSTDIYHDGFFIPHVPSSTIQMIGEDSVTPRVCVSTSIEGCLSAIPGGGSRLDTLNESQKGYYKVFEIDTEKLGISQDKIISSTTLYETEKVGDAEITGEHWILSEFQVPSEDMYVIYLYEWDEEINDLIPHRIVELADKEYDGDYFQAYYESMKTDFIPSINTVCNLQFRKESLKNGEKLEHFYMDNYELTELNDRFSLKGIKLVEESIGSFVVTGNDLSIEDLATNHQASSW